VDNIAIIGIGCLFPDYADKDKFWNTIISGGNFLYRDQFLETDIERSGLPYSGSDFFKGRLSDAELEELTPFGELFKWCAYVTDEAMKDAGYFHAKEKFGRTGMVVGSVAQTISDQIDVMHPFFTKTVAKEVNAILGGEKFSHCYSPKNENLRIESLLADTEPVRYIAQKRGFGGPVIMFNAACASPLYAIKLASFYLNSGEADIMIAGSHCSNETVAGISGLFDTFGILCGVGESLPMDKNSKGLITGSGAGVFVLKRLADAERDGDNILAVVESIGCSNDGGTGGGMLSPSAIGQIEAYEAAYTGGLSLDIDYIECHATGTTAGDKTEIESIERFFGYDYSLGGSSSGSRPMLGALKGSTGHFFTATACASIVKVIMAMQHEIIPATIGVNDPICEGILLENTPWKSGEKLRRAGINAFGLGGINAHLVISEYRGQNLPAPQAPVSVNQNDNHAGTDLAITGMGLHIGKFKSVEEFLQGLLSSDTAFAQADDDRFRGLNKDKAYMDALGLLEMPKGSYLNNLNFDTMRFKMPIVGDPYFLRRDMLMLEVAAEALDDAGVQAGSSPRTAVIVHSAPDYTDQLFMASVELKDSILESLKETCPELTDAQRQEVVRILKENEATRESADNVPGMITNIRGCRISAHWGFSAPSITIFEREISILRCLELARFFISEGIADQVVVGVSSFSGELEHIYTQKELGAMDLMLEHGIAEGAAALVLKSNEAATKCKDRVYAVINGLGISGVSQDTKANVETAIGKAIEEANIGKGDVHAVEIPKSYDLEQRSLVEQFCYKKYKKYLDSKSFNVLDIESYLGFGFSLSTAASIIRHALQLHLSRVFMPNSKENLKTTGKKPASLVTSYAKEKLFGCVVMTQSSSNEHRDRKLVSQFIPIPIPFDSVSELDERLQVLEAALEKKGLKQLHAQSWLEYRNACTAKGNGMSRGAVLLCDSKETLRDEISKLRRCVSDNTSFVGSDLEIDSFGFVEDENMDETLNIFAEQFGISKEILSSIGVSKALLLYKPAKYLMSLGSKLMLHGISFDYDKFFSNFDFYILNKPSYIRKIPTGMPNFLEKLGSEENRKRIQALAAKSYQLPEGSIPIAAIPKFHKGQKSNTLITNISKYYESLNGSNYVAPENQMIGKLLSAARCGGMYGLGEVITELDLHENHRIFELNADKSISLSKTLLLEAINQTHVLYAINAGYFTDGDSHIEYSNETPAKIKVPISNIKTVMRNELYVKSIKEHCGQIEIISTCNVFLEDVCVYKTNNAVIVISSKKSSK